MSSYDAHTVGETRINDHCTFRWMEPLGPGPRIYEIRPEHCARCVAELRARPHCLFREAKKAPAEEG